MEKVAALLILAAPSYQIMDNLDDVLVYAVEAPTNIRKRAVASKTSDSFDDFVEEKLVQHSQALEQLVRMVQAQGEVTKRLVENMSKHVDKPTLPATVEVPRPSRRFNPDTNQSSLSRLSQQIPKYGNLMKDLTIKEFSSDKEPNVVVEQSYKPAPKFTRRSMSGKVESVPSIKPASKSPWCTLALLCKRTVDPVCGFDDNFGYGKFEDMCHMFQVNCYWKYNFSAVASCKPKF